MASPLTLHFPDPARGWSWADFTGPDTADFLHRLTTVDVHQLDVGTGTPGCFLNPQGKVRVSYLLWRLSPQAFAFEYEAGTDRHWERALLETIDQYTFGEKLALAPRTDATCVWIFPERPDGWPPPRHTESRGKIRFNREPDEAFGRPWITAWGAQADLDSWLAGQAHSALTESLLEPWRIENLWPRPDREITAETLPLEAGMRQFIADSKGCYPGQEVIEKIISLGAPARRLALLEFTMPPAAGDVLRLDDSPAEVGRVTSVSPDRSPSLALALIRKTHAKEGMTLKFGGERGATVLRLAPYR